MRDIAINVFSGGQSADADLRTVQEGDWVSSRNVINYHIGQNGAIRAIMGNTEMDLSPVVLPEGVNTCIGAHEDEQSKSLIWFNHNSDGNHGIYRFYYETSRCDQVLVYTGLDFDVNRKITDIATIDGRYLIWTDAKAVVYDLGGVPQETNEGLQPRCLDMNLSTLYGATFQANSGNPYKALTYRIYLHWARTTVLDNQDIFIQIRTTDINGGNPSFWQTISGIPAAINGSAFEAYKAGVYNQMGLAIEALIPGTEWSDNLNHLEFTIPSNPTVGRRIEIRTFENGLPSEKVWAYLAPVNHYYYPYVDEQFNLALPMPNNHPVTTFVKIWDELAGDGNPINNGSPFYGTQTQWTYRYHFYDGRRSAWSPYSVSPNNIVSTSKLYHFEPIQEFNAILIRLWYDERLFDPQKKYAWSGFISKVEIAKRSSKDKPIESIGVFDPWDMNDIPSQAGFDLPFNDTDGGGIRGWQKIYKSNVGSNPVASDEVGSTSGVEQVLKLYDWIPQRVNGLCSVADETGTARIVLAGETFGYKNPFAEAKLIVEQRNMFGYLWSDPLDMRKLSMFEDLYAEKYTNKQLKKGGRYGIGIAYYDEYGVTPGPVKLGEVYIPYQGGSQAISWVNVEFASAPPPWAEYWRICITDNLNQGLYSQFLIEFAAPIDFNEEGSVDSSSPGAKSYIAIEISKVLTDSTDNEWVVNMFDQTNVADKVYWISEPKDRIQLVYTGLTAELIPNEISAIAPQYPQYANANIDSTAFNALIVGTLRRSLSESGTAINQHFVVIDYKDEHWDWLKWMVTANDRYFMVELYRPSYANPDFLKETITSGKVFRPQIPEFKFEAYHIDPQIGNSVTLLGGDTFLLRNPRRTYKSGPDTYTDINNYVESMTPYAFANEYLSDFGRILPADQGSKEEYNYQRVRISDAYTPSTKINGLSAFRGLNFIDVNKAYGPIMTLKNIRDDIAAVCWNKVQPIYVGKGRVLQLDGVEQIGRSSSLLQLALPLIEDWGTQNPESVVSDGRRLYGVDRRMCVVWRYSNDGMTPIGHYKNLNYFKKVIADTESSLTTGLNIYSAVHPRLEMFFFTLSDHVLAADTASPQYVAQRTWGFMETDNNWKGEYDFDPEYMKAAGVHLWTFKAGKLYKHHPGATPANFYGVQYYPEITFSANKNPGTTKVFQNIRMQSNEKWTAPAILIPANDPYSQGMMSRLKASNIRNEEGMFVADFLRDMNDPDFADIVSPSERQTNALLRGRNLRGEVIVVTLLGTPTADLIRVDTEFFMSMKTN